MVPMVGLLESWALELGVLRQAKCSRPLLAQRKHNQSSLWLLLLPLPLLLQKMWSWEPSRQSLDLLSLSVLICKTEGELWCGLMG